VRNIFTLERNKGECGNGGKFCLSSRHFALHKAEKSVRKTSYENCEFYALHKHTVLEKSFGLT